jgi:hypothetical protein
MSALSRNNRKGLPIYLGLSSFAALMAMNNKNRGDDGKNGNDGKDGNGGDGHDPGEQSAPDDGKKLVIEIELPPLKRNGDGGPKH